MTTPLSTGATLWNKRFATDDYLFGREPNEYLRVQTPLIEPGGRVLCVADGEGRNSVWLASRGLKVDAFDVSEVGVEKARRLALEAGVAIEFSVADCDQRPWPAAVYDAVVAVFVQFADPVMRERLFANLVRTLKPNGVLVLQGYTQRQLAYATGGPQELSHLYTAEMLRSSFANLDIIEIKEYDAALNEGVRHVGLSALIGLTARKPRSVEITA